MNDVSMLMMLNDKCCVFHDILGEIHGWNIPYVPVGSLICASHEDIQILSSSLPRQRLSCWINENETRVWKVGFVFTLGWDKKSLKCIYNVFL